jgi:DNA mismatch endonuclease Vsr
MLVRRFLIANGYRYRLYVKTLPRKPDIVLPKYKIVIFINGCFWHGHEGCRYFVVPKTRTEWWLEKITGTQKRDSEAEDKLKLRGWDVLKPGCISQQDTACTGNTAFNGSGVFIESDPFSLPGDFLFWGEFF